MPKSSTTPHPSACGCGRTCRCHRELRCRCHDLNAFLALWDYGRTLRRRRAR